MMEEDRMRLPGVGTPKQDYIRFFNLAIRTCPSARAENRRQTDDAGGVSSPIAAINIVAADHRANELLGSVVQLVGRLGATEHAERSRAMLLDLRPEALGHPVKSLVPCGGTMRTVFANERLSQPAL